ncbi:hypothetical protein VPHK120G1_0020 [Vibrio phage K120 g1]
MKKSRFAMHLSTKLESQESVEKAAPLLKFGSDAGSSGTYRSVCDHFPQLPNDTRYLLARVLKTIFDRAEDKGVDYTPFIITPEVSITYPQHVVDDLRVSKAVMPKLSEGDDMYVTSSRVSLTSMAELSRISKGSLSGINSHQQQLTVEGLEKWRKALAKVGKANPDIADVKALADMADPTIYLDALLSEWSNLTSSLGLKRIKEWAELYSGLDEDEIEQKVSEKQPTYDSYLDSMITIWRSQYKNGELPQYQDKKTLLEVLKTVTNRRSISRGFNDMITCVHDGMPSFNSRVKHSKSNYPVYKTRYDSAMSETGMTSSILMAYCLFTGINPISMLYWLAMTESKTPGDYNVISSYSLNEFMLWNGTISPVEYQKFFNEIHNLGLVSDQDRWALNLLSAEFVYKHVPDEEMIGDKLKGDKVNLSSVTTEYMMQCPSKSSIRIPDNCNTLFGLALSATMEGILDAPNDMGCLSLVSDGQVLGIFKDEDRKVAEDERCSMTTEAFTEFMLKSLSVRGDVEDYITVTINGVEKKAADVEKEDLNSRTIQDCQESYNHSAPIITLRSTTTFYMALSAAVLGQ